MLHRLLSAPSRSRYRGRHHENSTPAASRLPRPASAVIASGLFIGAIAGTSTVAAPTQPVASLASEQPRTDGPSAEGSALASARTMELEDLRASRSEQRTAPAPPPAAAPAPDAPAAPAPAAPAPPPPPAPEPAGLNTTGFAGAAAGIGLRGNARSVYSAVRAEFGITNMGGYRAGDWGDHGTGRAVDIMVSGAKGDAVAAYVMENYKALGVKYVIWKQRYWAPGSGWKFMADRGSATANHYDHVHVSCN